MAKQFGKDAAVDFAASNLMSFGKSFSTLNGQPLLKSEVWYDYESLVAFAKTDAAYVGQEVAYVDIEKSKVTRYIIQIDGSLKEGGSSAVGDEKTITIAEDGTISLFGVKGLEFTRNDTEGGVTKITYQPLLVDGKLTWVEPNATTVEGLATEIEGIKARLTIIEGAGEGSIKKIAEDTASAKVAEIVAGADTDFDTLKEVADWIKSDTTGAAKMQSQITAIVGEDTEEDGTAKSMRTVATEIAEGKVSASEKALIEKINAAKTEANSYTDTAKTELKTYTDNAKAEAITTAGTNADAKISAKVGEIGETTVKAYVDSKETTLKSQISAVDNKITNLGALATKDVVAETDLAEALQTKINGKADKGTTLAEYGITDAYTSAQTDSKIKAVSDKVDINTQDIAAITNSETGILAQAKSYADTKAYDDTAIKASVAKNTQDISAINNETTGILAQAKTYADGKVYNDTQVKADIKANTDAIAVLNGDKTKEGSVKKTVADEVAAIVAGAPEDFDTLKEIADWIANDTTNATKMANDIATVIGEDKSKSMRDVATDVVGKIPLASQSVAGLIKGTDNKVKVADGQITSISLDILEQGETILVLDGGASEI